MSNYPEDPDAWKKTQNHIEIIDERDGWDFKNKVNRLLGEGYVLRATTCTLVETMYRENTNSRFLAVLYKSKEDE